MSYGGGQKVQKVMVQPINLIFRWEFMGLWKLYSCDKPAPFCRYLQNRTRVSVWLYENVNTRIEGHIVGKIVLSSIFRPKTCDESVIERTLLSSYLYFFHGFCCRVWRVYEPRAGRSGRSSPEEAHGEEARQDHVEGRQHFRHPGEKCQDLDCAAAEPLSYCALNWLEISWFVPVPDVCCISEFKTHRVFKHLWEG